MLIIDLKPLHYFNRKAYIEIIEQWCDQRGIGKEEWIRFLPKWGSICFAEDGQALAASFLRICEGMLLMSDSTITNPFAKPKLRDQALNLLAKHLFGEAKRQGYFGIIAYSVDAHTLVRMSGLGFLKTGKEILSLDLKNFGG